MTGLLALLVVALALAATLLPLLGPEPAVAQPDEVLELEARRQDLLRGLKDIEMDHAMGKITDEDRERLKADLEGRAVRVLAAIDERSPPARGE